MGFVHGTQWTDELVQDRILNCVSTLGLKRMPSRQELHDFYGSDALTNKIRRSGGYYDWATRLGLPMKESETQTGKTGETRAKELLEQHGFYVQRMSTRYPYDLYVNGCVKVDVKTAHPTKTPGTAKCYSFGLSKKCPTCDVRLHQMEKKYILFHPLSTRHRFVWAREQAFTTSIVTVMTLCSVQQMH